MINRILIRIKAVQILYAYLLTRNEFSIFPAPDTDATADQRFAYRAYSDLLLLLIELSGISARIGHEPAIATDPKMERLQLGRTLRNSDGVREIIARGSSDISTLLRNVPALYADILASAAYTDFKRKRKIDLSDEVKLWETLLATTITSNKALKETFQSMDGYSRVGLEQAYDMVDKTLRSFYGANAGYAKAKADLQTSLTNAYQLYAGLFALIVEITREQARRIENAKSKYLATAEDLNPNMRFVNNALVAQIEENEQLNAILKDSPLQWSGEIALINGLLESITSSQLYHNYMQAPEHSVADDYEFWRNALKQIVFPSDALAEALEDRSIYWNDDLPVMSTFVLKTIRQAQNKPDAPLEILPKFKDDEDAEFGAELFVDTVKHHAEYTALIHKHIDTTNWDLERIAFMDMVVMETAISELLNFPNIPFAVTLNEYIEIAGAYSTGKAGQFINGVLYNIANELRRDGKLLK